jgi:dTDP-4-amino-4,6-dideoxygalactose transaminase
MAEVKTELGQGIPFALPDIGDDEIAAVVRCLRSGWITTGPVAASFETDMARFLGNGVHAVAVNSATSGLLLALEALGIQAGDEVITSTYTFSATAMTAIHLGALPVLADVDPRTLNIAPEQIEAKVTSRTKAIIPVHLGGLACDMDAINAIARRLGLKIIEDAAHSFPTVCGGRLVGSGWTDATVFSFYATKTITTGEGGMIATPHAQVAERARIMRLHGIDRDAFDRYRSTRSSWQYEIVAPGYKCNLTDIAAAIGVEQLKKTRAFQRRREEIARRYRAGLQDLPLIHPAQAPQDDVHAWHLYVIRLTDEAPLGRDEFIRTMSDCGINCSVHFIPLHMHSYWRQRLCISEADFPEATRAFQAAVSLPIYTRMRDEDVERVIATIRSILQ